MIYNPKYFQKGENIICLYDLAESSVIRKSTEWINNHEKIIFCDKPESPFIVRYKLLSKDEKTKLKIPIKNCFMLPFHQMGTLYDLMNGKHINFLPFFKKLPNYKNYFTKWIYQLINAVNDIHVKKKTYHGFLSDQCVFIDNKLNAQIGFIGLYDNDSRELYNYNYIKYFDDYRKSIYNKIPNNNKIKFDEYLASEEQNTNKDQVFRRHDIFALGILLKDIITSMKNEDSDQTFENRIEKEIINLCLEPPESRPNIEKIKTILDQIISENLYNVDTVDIETLLYDTDLSKLTSCSLSQLIAMKLKNKENYTEYLHTASDTNLISFNLHNNYKFKVHYDLDEKCFITEPCLCDEFGLNLKIFTFNDILRKKMTYVNRLFFFHNIYFCSLRDLLKIYEPTFTEIHYWLIYLTNYIFGIHSGDFLEEEIEEEIEADLVPDAHLPLNFSSETVLVSFFRYENYNKFEEFKNSPLKFQLSIFPFDTKETNLSNIYKSNTQKKTIKNDLYSYGVLILELLNAAIFGKTCFEGENKVDETMKNVIQNLPDDQKFYSEILKGCINKTFENAFEILTHLFLQGKSDDSDFDQEFSIENFPSDCLNKYINDNTTMDLNRFIGIFKCYDDFPNQKIQEIFVAILSDLSQKFFSGDNDIVNELYFLNFCDFLDSQEKKSKK